MTKTFVKFISPEYKDTSFKISVPIEDIQIIRELKEKYTGKKYSLIETKTRRYWVMESREEIRQKIEETE